MVISNIYKTFIITSFKKLAVPAEALAKNIEVHGMVRLRSHKMRTMLDNLRFCYQIFLFAKQFTPAVARRSSLERRWWKTCYALRTFNWNSLKEQLHSIAGHI